MSRTSPDHQEEPAVCSECEQGDVGRSAEQALDEQEQLGADDPIVEGSGPDASPDQGELLSYAEQQLPQLGGPEEADAQRREADHVQRAGGRRRPAVGVWECGARALTTPSDSTRLIPPAG